MKISVIIRCCNEERWIGHAIQSIIDLFDSGSEIIIVDNNSSDESRNIIKLFENENVNSIKIKYYNIDTYSPGTSINFGVKNCTNDIILIMSAHCVIQKIKYKKIINLLDNYIAIGGKQIPIYFGKKINRNRYIWQNFEDEDKINFFSYGENRYFLHNALCFYKKNTLIKHPFDEKLVGKEDRYWAIDRISNGDKIYYDSELECQHHYTKNGSTWKNI